MLQDTRLGTLSAIDIGFASERTAAGRLGAMLGAAWLLSHVEVTHVNSSASYTFHHGDWLQPGKAADRVELLPGSAPDKTMYKIAVYTSGVRGAGTDANVRVTLFGKVANQGDVQYPAAGQDGAHWRRRLHHACMAEGPHRRLFAIVCTVLILLPDPMRTPTPGAAAGAVLDDRSNNFERGRCDEFLLETGDLGALQKIVLSIDGSGFASDWHLRQVVVTNCTSQAATTFPFDGWFSKKAGLRHVRAARCPLAFFRRQLRLLLCSICPRIITWAPLLCIHEACGLCPH